MDITFHSEEELYERLLPALRTKKKEMHRYGFTYIKEEDIWNYLKEVKWIQSKNLKLFEMTDDILNTDDIIIDDHFKKSLRTMKREKNITKEEYVHE